MPPGLWRPSLACSYARREGCIRRFLFQLPSQAAEPPLYIAGRGDEIVLEFGFCQSSIPGVAQTVSPNQLALGALDRVAMAHLHFKRVGFLLLAALLEDGVVGADNQGAVFMLRLDTLSAQQAGRADRALPFKAVRHSTRRFFLQGTALGILVRLRTNRY